MKKLLFTVLIALVSMVSFAQVVETTESSTSTTKMQTRNHTKGKGQTQVANPAAYACPKCFMISKGEGNCEHCKVAKVQLGTYYCTKCMKSTGAKAGNCPSCNGATTQMTRKYCAKNGNHQEMDENHKNHEKHNKDKGDKDEKIAA